MRTRRLFRQVPFTGENARKLAGYTDHRPGPDIGTGEDARPMPKALRDIANARSFTFKSNYGAIVADVLHKLVPEYLMPCRKLR